MIRILILILGIFFNCIIHTTFAQEKYLPAITAEIPLSQIDQYQIYPVSVKNLIHNAYLLSQKKLTYLYGSADPANRGMDCSGTIYYLLTNDKVADVPRDSSGMFTWVEQKGNLYRVTSNDFSSKEFDALKPGDLLFWSGTYNIQRENAITHVMIYLGKNKQGQRLMFGASDGRTYQGKKMWGVSVFDFVLPKANEKAKFIGYSCIPQLTCLPGDQKNAS